MAQQKPIHDFRLGHIRAAIWANQNDGRVRYAVTIVRRYRNGTEWKDTTTFNAEDLLVVAHLAKRASDWILEHPNTEPTVQDVED